MPDLDSSGGRLLPVHGTRLHVVEHGSPSAFPLICLHGGPGDGDDGGFGSHLDALTLDGRYRLVLVDQREQGRSDRGTNPETWTRHQLASDVSAVAAGLGVDDYAVLGHGAAAVVALQHAVDAHGAAAATIVSFPPAGDGGMAALTPRLTEVPQPVLVVGPDSRRIAELLPCGEAAGLEAPFTTEAGAYCDVVREFLDRAVTV